VSLQNKYSKLEILKKYILKVSKTNLHSVPVIVAGLFRLGGADVLGSVVGSELLLLLFLHDGNILFLGLEDCDVVGQGNLAADLAFGIVGKHDLDLDAENTLLHHNVSGGGSDVVVLGFTSRDHVTVLKLHNLSTLGRHFTGNGDFATLGAVLHDEADDTVASTTDGELSEEFVTEGLALGHGARSAVLDTLGEELNRVLGELETLLDHGGQFANTGTTLTEDILGAGGTDNDLGSDGSNADLDTGVSILGEGALEEIVQFSVEDTISDEFALFGDVAGLSHFDI